MAQPFTVSHDLTTEIININFKFKKIIKNKNFKNKNKKKNHITSTSVKVKEMMNYFLHQKLKIKPTATESLTSRKVHLLLFHIIFISKGINDRDNNLFYLECFLEIPRK